MDLVPPSSHFIYIPAIAILGLVLGFIWGTKATREAFVLEARREAERAERAKRKAARKADKGTPTGGQDTESATGGTDAPPPPSPSKST